MKVAVLPFYNDSTRKNAGEIVRLQILRHLVEEWDLVVLDPGEIRLAILNSRTILQGGISVPQGTLLREFLGANLMFTGNVRDYQDAAGSSGIPVVNFSGQVLDAKAGKMVWSSISYNRGDDGVFFFDWGKVNTAYSMASEMAKKVVQKLLHPANGRGEPPSTEGTSLSGR